MTISQQGRTKLPKQSLELRIDLFITALVTALVCWFTFQYGYSNSPDSYYRGILAKSIIEGHPYFINMVQGWLYDKPIWHHNAAHEPLLPFIYSVLFFVFGAKISITNIVSSVAAGLFIFPLLQLSRRLSGSAIIGALIYLAIVLNEGISYFFEVYAGLSISTYTLLLALLLLNFDIVLHSSRKLWIWTGATLVACLYLTRSEAQPLLFLVAFVSIIAAPRLIDYAANKRLRRLWLLSALLILPWFLRKVILFGNPFFSHMTPLLWMDDAYEYWDYSESGNYPTSSTYFECHTFPDFLEKIFITGTTGFYQTIERALPGPAWSYILLLFISLITILVLAKSSKRRFFYIILSTFIIGYIGLYSLVHIFAARYLIAPFFLTILIGSIATSIICGRILHFSKIASIITSILIIATGSAAMQWSFWRTIEGKLHYAYTTSDQRNEKDKLIIGLKNRFPAPTEVDLPILGPFADVQRLTFTTGLSFVEVPTNLKELIRPQDFFERYNIRYSLVDITKLFPNEPDVKFSAIGYGFIYEVPKFDATEESRAVEVQAESDIALAESVARGIQSRIAYVSSELSSTNIPFEFLTELGIKVRVLHDDFECNESQLFRSGLLIFSYRGSMDKLSAKELEVIFKYLDNGGRLLIIAPGWVWASYENKGLGELPYNQILQYFNVAITANYITPPLSVVDPLLHANAVKGLDKITASELIYGRRSVPLIVGAKEGTLAIRTAKNRSRAVVFGHDYLLHESNLSTPEGRDAATRILDWLFSTD